MINISNKYNLTIFHISDLHGTHRDLKVPKADIMIVSGDATNRFEPWLNEKELHDFIDWYSNIDIKYKIYVPGNHDTFCFNNNKLVRELFKLKGIIYLDKDSVEIEGLLIYGDPTTPLYGNWAFMADRAKIHKHWEAIPNDVNILITHGPPKRTLDVTENRFNDLELVGCNSLRRRIDELPNLILNCFGHIHDTKNITNAGVLYRDGKWFSNASAVQDGKIGELKNTGNLFKL